MITQQRKGRDKFVVVFSPAWADPEQEEIRQWCTASFGPGGRNKRCAWRYGWTDTTNNYYFKHEKHVMLFMLRWS